jgi:hypothetical protein
MNKEKSMSDEEIKKLEEELGNLRKAKEEVKESFSHMPDIQSKILSNLNAHEKLLLDLIKEKYKEV